MVAMVETEVGESWSFDTWGPVAQRIRHLTTNQGIAGSNPARVNILATLLLDGKEKKARPRVGSNHQPFG